MVNYLSVNGTQITVATIDEKNYISLTDMLKAERRRSFHLGLASQSQHH